MRSNCKVALLIIFHVCVINVTTEGQLQAPGGQDVGNSGQLSLSDRSDFPAADAADKKRRDDILGVVNNNLSSDGCKKTVLGQLGDGTQCLRDGCVTLEHFKDLVSIVGCTSQDYDKLHAVICVPSDPPCTTAPPSPQTTEKTEDEKRREDILNVVHNNLSSDGCKTAVLGQLGDGTQCLRDGCVTLQGFKDLITLVGCTSQDYDKLHAVICVPSDPPCTTAPPSPQTTEKTEDEKRREDILNVVHNNLSSDGCKTAVLGQLGDGTQCLRDGCVTLQGFKDLITLVGCTSQDYDKLHAVICVPSDPPCLSSTLAPPTVVGVGTTKAPAISQEQAQKNQIRCTIEKQMSSVTCMKVVKSQTSEDENLNGACAKLESFANLITSVGCIQADYNKLHAVICNWDGTERCIDYVQKQKDAIAEIENGLSNSCNKSISSNIRSANLPTYCANIKQSKDILLSNRSCDVSEIGNLTNIVCCNGSQCFEPDVDPSTRKGQVTLAIRALSDQCARTMTVAIDEFSQAPKVACQALEDTKSTLLNAGVCSEMDYSSISEVVCKFDACDTAGGCTTVYDPYANEKPQRDIIQAVIFNDVEEKCKNFMTDVAQHQIADPLVKTCRSFLDNYGFIVIGGQCTETDYNKLKLVICAAAGKAESNAAIIIIGAIFVLVKTLL